MTRRIACWLALAALGLGCATPGPAAVTTTGSIYDSGGELHVGYTADGTLRIDAGSSLSRSYGYVGCNSGCIGTATVTGTGSTWTNSAFLGVGMYGSGTLNIEAGGQINSYGGCLGSLPGSNGTATVTGTGSTWTNSGYLYVGNNIDGSGTLNIEAGGQVSNTVGSLGYNSGSNGTATVTGTGSTWTNSGYLYVGEGGSGTLNIQVGGQVSNSNGYLGFYSGSTGTATVSGTGSTWTSSGEFWVGSSGSGKLTVADGGKVTARSLTANNNQSVARLHVSGNDILVLGDAITVGSLTNNGAINLYADALLPAGVYTPISEYAGRAMTWSGTGAYNAIGGTWDNAAKTFLVTAATTLMAGSSDAVSTAERLLFADPASGQRVGAGFGTVAGGTTFSADLMTQSELSALMATLGFSGAVLSGWDFTTNLTGGQALLSFDIGLGKQDLKLWHLQGATWTPYAPDLQTYDSHGILSFTASQFSGYAVAGVPEPSTFALLGVGAIILLIFPRWRRKA